MLGLIRRSLWWLVVLALPMQAMAGTIGLHCAGMHGRMAGVPTASAPHRHEAGAQTAAHDHRAAASDAASVHHQTGAATAHADPDDHAARGSCSACAACCAALALPAAMQDWPAADFGQAVPGVASVERLTFLTSGPDRPPRTPTL